MPRETIDRRTTRTIPDDVLDTIAAHDAGFARLVAMLRDPAPGTHVGRLERHIASNYTRLTIEAGRLGLQQFWDLCCCAAGRAYGDHR